MVEDREDHRRTRTEIHLSPGEAKQREGRKMRIQISDRYSLTGIPYPDPKTVCKGQCEGMGCVPVFVEQPHLPTGLSLGTEEDPTLLALWYIEHQNAGEHICDGWHFVKCPECDGTGKRIDRKASAHK